MIHHSSALFDEASFGGYARGGIVRSATGFKSYGTQSERSFMTRDCHQEKI